MWKVPQPNRVLRSDHSENENERVPRLMRIEHPDFPLSCYGGTKLQFAISAVAFT
jgi:hypothetical protein